MNKALRAFDWAAVLELLSGQTLINEAKSNKTEADTSQRKITLLIWNYVPTFGLLNTCSSAKKLPTKPASSKSRRSYYRGQKLGQTSANRQRPSQQNIPVPLLSMECPILAGW